MEIEQSEENIPLAFDFVDVSQVCSFARLERQRQRGLPDDDPLKLPLYGRIYPIYDFADQAVVRISQIYTNHRVNDEWMFRDEGSTMRHAIDEYLKECEM